MNPPFVSIITVVYNNIEGMKKTLESIANQTCKNYEHIVIDGNSTDGTKEFLEKEKSRFAYFISEPDQGLYDAMNKALEKAKGLYVWFINSGDEIFDIDTISQLETWSGKADILYGECLYVNDETQMKRLRSEATPQQVPNKLTLSSLYFGMCVSHQSILILRSIVPFYQLSFNINADYEWLIRIMKNNPSTQNTSLVLSKFLEGGISKQRFWKGMRQRFQVMRLHFGLLKTIGLHCLIIPRYLFFLFLKK